MKPWPSILPPLLAFAAGLTAGYAKPDPDDLWILDVGQGDCAVLRHAGATLLIDDGPIKKGGPPVLEALRRRGIDRVDLILLSHPDADHVGGTAAILQRYPDAKVAISADFLTQPKMDRDIASWGLPLASVLWLPERADVRIPSCTLHIVCPPVRGNEDDNRGSMFVRIDDQGATADFSGDAPSDVEQQVAASGSWQADLLHVGHHGSRTSSGEAWLSAVHPALAVISCGRNNPYGHPHQATLERLAKAGIKVERTDLQGDLVFLPVNGHFLPRQ